MTITPTMLPEPFIKSRWVSVTQFPTRKRFGKHSLILERCWTHDGKPHSVKVAYVRDHPFLRNVLSKLPHVPRAVKSLYRGDVRLAFKMAKDGWHVIRAMDDAGTAWRTYLMNRQDAA